MATRDYRFIRLLFFCAVIKKVSLSAGRATPCMTLLRTLDVEDVYQDVVTDERITATSFDPSYPPHEARLSGLGWCAESVCTMGPSRQYLQIDYGSEVVLEAIAIDSNDVGFYVNEYIIEYAGSDGVINCMVDPVTNSTIFRGVDICRQRTNPDLRSFMYPVIAKYVRVVPLSWEGPSPCLTVELYGCPVLECSRTRAVSDNANILPAENIEYSSMALTQGTDSISTGWCATDSSPHFIANFTKPVHLLYAMASGYSIYYLTDFSYFYENQSGEMIPYINVDGERVFGLESVDEESFLLWEPITTRRLHFVVLGSSSGTFNCIEIHFYGCPVSEVINHIIPNTTTSSLCEAYLTPQPASTVAVVTSVVVSSTIVITGTITTSVTVMVSSISTSCSSSVSNVVVIYVPIAVAVVTIIVIMLVIVGVVIWWKMRMCGGSHTYNNKATYNKSRSHIAVKKYHLGQGVNDGQVIDDSSQDVQDGRNAVIESSEQASAYYVTPNPVYDEVSNPVASGVLLTSNPSYVGFAKVGLEPNPSYQRMEITKTDQSYATV